MSVPIIETHRLKNGLRVAVAPMAGSSFVELVLGVRVGSRYEPLEQAGISHLLEHLLFRGSREYPSSFLLNHALESLGDGLVGGTAREYSMYSVSVPPENLERVLGILADLFRYPLLDEIETEKEIIFEEILEELDEKGQESDAFNLSRMMLFGDHPMGRPVLGRRVSLERVDREALWRHFERFYMPANLVLMAAGKVDPDRFVSQVQAAFGDEAELPSDLHQELENGTPLACAPEAASGRSEIAEPGLRLPSGETGPRVRYISKPSSQIEVTLSFVTRGERSPEFVAQLALERVLDDGLASRLQRSLCERKGLLYDIDATLEGYSDVGVLDFTFRMAASKARPAVREVFHELLTLRRTPIDAQELHRIKSRMHRDAQALFESPRALAHRTVEVLLLDLKTPLSLLEWTESIRALDAEKILKAAQEIFVPERMCAVIEGKLPRIDKGDIGQILELGLTSGF